MTVMTFNIQHARNFLTGQIDCPRMADTIAAVGADLVGLNEVYGAISATGTPGQDAQIAAALGDWQSYFAEAIPLSRHGYGNGAVSRFPILEAETIALPSPPPTHPGYYEDRCILRALIDTPEGVIRFLCCHFGLQPEEETLAVSRICELLDEEAEKDLPTVLVGDFNLPPESPILDPIRARLQDTDDYCEGEHFTFPTDAPTEKIDYIFVSRHWKIQHCRVPKLVAADHLPVVAEITLQ